MIRLAALGPALLALVLAACGGAESAGSSADAAAGASAPAAAASPARITVKTFIFAPQKTTVPAGTTVTWDNQDGTTHTVVAGTRAKPTGDFDLELRPNGSARHTFEAPGAYRYVCDLHPGGGMTGEVVVQ